MKLNEPSLKLLTKTRFKIAMECTTKLRYHDNYKYGNVNKEDAFLSSLSKSGDQVGELAKYYFSNGQDLTNLSDKQATIKTNDLLMNNHNIIIYEAAIIYKNLFARIDILIKKNKNIEIVEVKSKSFKSKKDFLSRRYLKKNWKPYLYDIAFQNFAIKKAYPNYTYKQFLMLPDKSKKSFIDGLNQLFPDKKNKVHKNVIDTKISYGNSLGKMILSKIEVTDIVDMIYDGKDTDRKKSNTKDNISFNERINLYSDQINDSSKDKVLLGKKCGSCEFNIADSNFEELNGYDECWKSIYPSFDKNEPHIFSISKLSEEFVDTLISKNIIYQKQLYRSKYFDVLSPRQKMQVSGTVKNNNFEHVDSLLYDEMKKWNYPYYFIDFETCMTALPFHKNRYPYDQIAFQYSCHVINEDKTIDHHEFLHTKRGEFPNFLFLKSLRKLLDLNKGTIFCYSSYESSVLRQIKTQMKSEDHKKYEEDIKWITSILNLVKKDGIKDNDLLYIDLLDIIRKYYYHPKMGGSNSIKYVLPAIFESSDFVKNRYQKPLDFGTNLEDQILYQKNKNDSSIKDPYELLNTSQFNDLQNSSSSTNDTIVNGGQAMTAYAQLQNSDISKEKEKNLIVQLKRYCELDTLAMLIIFQHLNDLKKRHS